MASIKNWDLYIVLPGWRCLHSASLTLRVALTGQSASHFLTAHAHSARVARYRQTGTLTGCPVNAQQKHKFLAPCGARDAYSGGVSPGI